MLAYTVGIVGLAVIALYVGFMVVLDSQLDAMENAFEERPPHQLFSGRESTASG